MGKIISKIRASSKGSAHASTASRKMPHGSIQSHQAIGSSNHRASSLVVESHLGSYHLVPAIKDHASHLWIAHRNKVL